MVNSSFLDLPQKDISIRQYAGKSPMFFRRVNIMGALFPANLEAVREALPDSSYRPLQLIPGRGLVAIACMEYLDTDIGPYNEVSLAVPVVYGDKRHVPASFSWLGSALNRSFGIYVKELPVTTEVALYGGLDFFNFPKYLADISFRETSAHWVCTLRDRPTMDLIFEMELKKPAVRSFSRPLDVWTYPVLHQRTMKAKMSIQPSGLGISMVPWHVSIRIGSEIGESAAEPDHARPFRELRLGRAIQSLWMPSCQAILFEPEAL